MIKRFRNDRRGDVWAFTSIAILFIVLPLASLSVDVVRGMYVRTHLQAAADAACQAAANALDVPSFRSTGKQQINQGLGRSQAAGVFSSSLADASKVEFSPSLAVGFTGPTTAHCTATATLVHLIPLTPPMTAVVQTTSQMRVVQR